MIELRTLGALRGIDSGVAARAVEVAAATIILPPVVIGVAVGAWTRSWKSGAAAGAISLVLSGGLWWWMRRANMAQVGGPSATAPQRSNAYVDQPVWDAAPRATLRTDQAGCRNIPPSGDCWTCPPGMHVMHADGFAGDVRCLPMARGA